MDQGYPHKNMDPRTYPTGPIRPTQGLSGGGHTWQPVQKDLHPLKATCGTLSPPIMGPQAQSTYNRESRTTGPHSWHPKLHQIPLRTSPSMGEPALTTPTKRSNRSHWTTMMASKAEPASSYSYFLHFSTTAPWHGKPTPSVGDQAIHHSNLRPMLHHTISTLTTPTEWSNKNHWTT